MMPLFKQLNRKGENNLGTTEEQSWISWIHTPFKIFFVKWDFFPPQCQLYTIDIFVSLFRVQIKKRKLFSSIPNSVIQKRWHKNPKMLYKQLITWEMAIKHTWLTWFNASASNFWFIPHKFATFIWHLWCTFIPHSKRNVRMVIQASQKCCLTLQQKGLFLRAVQARLDMDLSLVIKLQL